MNYTVGSLVRARAREWVVLPESEDDLLMLRPLGGTEDEVTGIYLPLEPVESARLNCQTPHRAATTAQADCFVMPSVSASVQAQDRSGHLHASPSNRVRIS